MAGSEWVFYIPRAGTVCHNCRFLQDAVIHSRSCISKSLLKSASQDKMNVLSMTVCRWYQLIVPVCVCVNRFLGHFAARLGDMSAACRHVCYPVSELANFRQSACRKQQTLVTPTKLCRKRKRLLETTKPCQN